MTANAVNGFLNADEKWVNHELTNPLSILVLNLMPTRRNTEAQFLHRFSEISSDAELTFMYPQSHQFKDTSRAAIERDYVCLDQIRDAHFDGLIVTGAPGLADARRCCANRYPGAVNWPLGELHEPGGFWSNHNFEFSSRVAFTTANYFPDVY